MAPKKGKGKLPLRGQVETTSSHSLSVSSAPLPTPSLKLCKHGNGASTLANPGALSIFELDPSLDAITSSRPPSANIADDPFGVTDPYRIRETEPVIDRGEIWQLIDDPKRRENGRKEWEEAHQIDLSAKPEGLYPEPPNQFAVPYSEWSKRRVDALLKHREARRCGLIKDQDIHDAIGAGPAVIEQLRDRERRWILDKEGIPPRRLITQEDLDILYQKYVELLTAPGHKVPGCIKCETASAQGKLCAYTIIKKTRGGATSDEQWHYPTVKEAIPVEPACNKFLRALVGFARQEKKAEEQAPLVAENIKREQAGKKAIPLDETCVEKWLREIEEGSRPGPPEESISESETEEEAAKQWGKDFKASQDGVKRMRAEEDENGTRIAWQRYRSQDRFLQMRGTSAAENLERPYSRFGDYYPVGLPCKGKLIHDKAEMAPEDWERFKENRAVFEEEEGKTLPEGPEKEKWNKYIDGVLEEYKPPRGILTSKAKGSHLESLFSEIHLDHIINTPLV
ncbi:MAG: hypothetical protein Q9170_005717 [Blastenia crenularia]